MNNPLPPPHLDLKVSVVVPARNEEDLVGSCLEALANQSGVSPEKYEVLLVLDRCTDATEEKALAVAARHPDLRLCRLQGSGRGAGHARRTGMEEACRRLCSLGRPHGLIASTDADTVVAPDWLGAQLAAADRGARAIGGRIDLMDEAGLPSGVSGWRLEQGHLKQRNLLSSPHHNGGAKTEHWQFSGASLALTAETYKEVGGLEPRAALEDEYLERALLARGVAIERPLDVRVATSARLVGRATRGLARDLALASWVRDNTHDAHDFDAADLLERKRASGTSVSAVVLAKGRGRGTADLLQALAPLAGSGLVDETMVLSPAGDLPLSPSFDVRLFRDTDLMPDFGPVRGYGDALWRGLSATTGEISVFLDPCTPDPEGRRTLGLLGPLLVRRDLDFVKGFSTEPDGGPDDACTRGLEDLAARPLLNLYFPGLAGFVEPLSSEFAARRELLASLPFPAGYGASLSLLLDAAQRRGVAAVAQTRLGPRLKPRHRIALADQSEAAHAVLAAATSRALGDERLDEYAPGPLFLPLKDRFELRRVAVEERPPLNSL